jgi:hypothetical protein
MVFKYLFYDRRLPEEDVWRKLEEMKIIHIHGCIGGLKEIEFGNSENEYYNSIAKNIKTVWEEEGKYRMKIQNYFKVCERIFFIGFGWLEDNMMELSLYNKENKLLRGKEIHGTAFEMSESNIKYVENRLKLCGALQPNIKNCEAVNLIKDFF